MMCKYAQLLFAAIPLGGRLMNWDDLRFFLALAREGTVSGAGRVLSVKHTTVARRIAALEEQLGSRLFDRLRGGYAMTQAAENLYHLGLARMPCYVGDSEPSLRRIDVALTPSTWGVWVLSHVDLRSTARVRVCRDFLIDIIEQQRDLIEGLTSRYH